MNKTLIILAIVSIPVVLLGQSQSPTTLTTLSGKTYKNARVFRVEADGINYMFTEGMAKIPFTDLPESVRKEYGYNPQEAAAYAQADAQAQNATYLAVQRANAEEMKRKQEANEMAAADIAAMPKNARVGGLNTLQTGGLQTSSPDGAYGQTGDIWTQKSGRVGKPTTERQGSKTAIRGSVISVSQDEGVILVSSPTDGSAQVVAVRGIRHIEKIVDDDKVEVSGIEDGTFSYTTSLGAAATVRAYKFVSGHVHGPDGKFVD